MFDFADIEEMKLSAGSHASASEGLCFMEAVAWFEGEEHSDRPACACPVLGAYGIKLNDTMPDDVRNALLRPLVPLIAGTADKASEVKRAQFLAMWATNKVLPIVLRSQSKNDLARQCEAARTLDEAKIAANAAASDAANAAAFAAYAASASAYVSAAAYAAYAAAAKAAAKAAANAAYATASDAIWSVAVEGLRQAILIGRHEGFTATETALVERRAKLAELV